MALTPVTATFAAEDKKSISFPTPVGNWSYIPAPALDAPAGINLANIVSGGGTTTADLQLSGPATGTVTAWIADRP